MTKLALPLDMRAPAFAGVPRDFYRIGLDMAQWADANGFAECMLSEHHGTDDGYLPSPLVYGAAIAARTEKLRILVSALVLPLHNPIRIAEDAAVLDQLSNGRLDLVMVAGFRPPEFALSDRPLAGRGKVLEESISVLRKAYTGTSAEIGTKNSVRWCHPRGRTSCCPYWRWLRPRCTGHIRQLPTGMH